MGPLARPCVIACLLLSLVTPSARGERRGGWVIQEVVGNGKQDSSVGTPAQANNLVDSSEKVWYKYSTIIGLVALGGLGFLFLLFGHRLFKVTLFIVAFLVAAGIVFTILIKHFHFKLKWILLAAGIAGLICGGLALYIFKLGLFTLGAFFGFWLATLILSIAVNIDGKTYSLMTYLDEEWQYYLAIGIVSAFFGLLILTEKLQKLIIVIGTSLGGAMALGLFTEHWVKTGFGLAIEAVFTAAKDKDIGSAKIDNKAWAVFALVLALAAFGIWFQLRNAKKKEEKEQLAHHHHHHHYGTVQ